MTVAIHFQNGKRCPGIARIICHDILYLQQVRTRRVLRFQIRKIVCQNHDRGNFFLKAFTNPCYSTCHEQPKKLVNNPFVMSRPKLFIPVSTPLIHSSFYRHSKYLIGSIAEIIVHKHLFWYHSKTTKRKGVASRSIITQDANLNILVFAEFMNGLIGFLCEGLSPLGPGTSW
jgi:hypothetical protein